MPKWIQAAGAVRVFALSFLATITGCTISIQPWTKPPPPAPPSQFSDGNPLNPNMMMKNNMHQMNSPPNNEATAQMIKNLNEEQDLRNSLQSKVASLNNQIKDREEKLRLASYEMEESSKTIKRTREEFRQWQAEMEELRERIRKLEEYRGNAKPLIDEINRLLERDKEPTKSFKVQAPKQ